MIVVVNIVPREWQRDLRAAAQRDGVMRRAEISALRCAGVVRVQEEDNATAAPAPVVAAMGSVVRMGGGNAAGVVVPQMTQPPLVTEPSEYQVIVAPAAIWTRAGAARVARSADRHVVPVRLRLEVGGGGVEGRRRGDGAPLGVAVRADAVGDALAGISSGIRGD